MIYRPIFSVVKDNMLAGVYYLQKNYDMRPVVPEKMLKLVSKKTFSSKKNLDVANSYKFMVCKGFWTTFTELREKMSRKIS